MFVTTSGAVTAAQIERSAGFDFDVAAIARAKQLQFLPAQRNGSPTGVWVLLPVETTPAPEACPTMAVPLSAGFATFADSEVLERPELGTLYRYQEMGGGLALDVFVYPQASWPRPADQVRDFLESLEVMRARGEFASYDVQKQGDLKVKVRGGRPRHDFEVRGDAVRAVLSGSNGEKRTTYFAIFPQGESYIKFRSTYVPDRRAQRVVDEFIQQVLSARASTPRHCSP
jgi:TonB family protein